MNKLPSHNLPINKFQMIKDISKLRISNPQSRADMLKAKQDEDIHSIILALINANPTWSIDSFVKYAMNQYKDIGCTPKIISDCINDYIMDNH